MRPSVTTPSNAGTVPVLLLDRYDIGVVAEHEWPLRAVAAQPRDEHLAVRRRLDVLAVDALGFDEPPRKRAAGFSLPGRVRGIDLEVAHEEVERLGEDRLPIHQLTRGAKCAHSARRRTEITLSPARTETA